MILLIQLKQFVPSVITFYSDKLITLKKTRSTAQHFNHSTVPAVNSFAQRKPFVLEKKPGQNR